MRRANRDIPDLSKPEYDILRVLWKKGGQSVREMHNVMEKSNGWALTTTRTVMDRMVNKGLLRKKNAHGVFVFEPLISRPAGLAKMVRFFADRVLETDVNTVVSMFSNMSGLTGEEIDELRRLLKEE
ncbi:BlaI/MecI/CopY family transcriptional regulator [bacterium]|nr:BlaI/MecI/CopY family transcriptional regulator [bacterium]